MQISDTLGGDKPKVPPYCCANGTISDFGR